MFKWIISTAIATTFCLLKEDASNGIIILDPMLFSCCCFYSARIFLVNKLIVCVFVCCVLHVIRCRCSRVYIFSFFWTFISMKNNVLGSTQNAALTYFNREKIISLRISEIPLSSATISHMLKKIRNHNRSPSESTLSTFWNEWY